MGIITCLVVCVHFAGVDISYFDMEWSNEFAANIRKRDIGYFFLLYEAVSYENIWLVFSISMVGIQYIDSEYRRNYFDFNTVDCGYSWIDMRLGG